MENPRFLADNLANTFREGATAVRREVGIGAKIINEYNLRTVMELARACKVLVPTFYSVLSGYSFYKAAQALNQDNLQLATQHALTGGQLIAEAAVIYVGALVIGKGIRAYRKRLLAAD